MTTQRWLGRPTNVALGAIVSHIFWYSAAHHLGPLAGIGAHLEPRTDLVRRVMVSIAEFVVLALTVSATFRTSSGSLRSSESGDESVIALWAVSAIMLTPTAWIHYLVILLIPYAVLLRGELNGEAAPLAARLGLASFVVGELMLTVDLMPAIVPSSATLKLQDIEFWATLIGWPICLLLAYAAIYLQALGTKRRPAQPAAIAEAAQAASS
jgi:chromate transport protein ChrA